MFVRRLFFLLYTVIFGMLRRIANIATTRIILLRQKKMQKNAPKNLQRKKLSSIFAASLRERPNKRDKINDSVAQLVEQLTLTQWVESSSLSGVTKQNGKTPQSTEIT